LGDGDAELLGFSEIKLAAVLGRGVPFEALDQPSSFGGRERFVERRLAVNTGIVLDQHDVLASGKWIPAKSFSTWRWSMAKWPSVTLTSAPALERRE
jgi:hypothetical protein